MQQMCSCAANDPRVGNSQHSRVVMRIQTPRVERHAFGRMKSPTRLFCETAWAAWRALFATSSRRQNRSSPRAINASREAGGETLRPGSQQRLAHNGSTGCALSGEGHAQSPFSRPKICEAAGGSCGRTQTSAAKLSFVRLQLHFRWAMYSE